MTIHNLIWHPFTQHGVETERILIKNAQGACLYTQDNQEIIDCISSWWTITHGHNHPVLNHALHQQIAQLSHVMFAGFTHDPALQLAQSLIAITNHHFHKVFFADNGSGAIEVALKMAYQYHYIGGHPEKTVFVALKGAYHGDTFGAMATGRTTGFYNPFEPFLCDVKFLDYPEYDSETDTDNLLMQEQQIYQQFTDIIEQSAQKISCLILEPLLQGASGMRLARPEFIKNISQIARDANILVIYDEVATGFARTGSLFAYQQVDFIPDFLCLSKGLTAGYLPLSVTLTQDKIYQAFLGKDFKNAFTHGHSFTANPLACTVANASIALFKDFDEQQFRQKFIDLYRPVIEILQSKTQISRIRHLGTMLAWTYNDSEQGYKSLKSEALKDKFLQQGLNIRPLGNHFYLMPPYCINEQHVDKINKSINNIFY